MKTTIIPSYLETSPGQRADKILRNCVHCGFCNATCPTYQVTGDELDGPRGRIYLIKQVLEGNAPGEHTQLHLDRCLTCRNCETTCPSGVHYSRLLDIGRGLVEHRVKRKWTQRIQRSALRKFFLSPLFGPSLQLGRLLRPAMPAAIKKSIPLRNDIPESTSSKTHTKKVLLVQGCVQKSLQPAIDVAAARVFDAIGIQAVVAASSDCCGALSHHLGAEQAALQQIRHNIDSWLSLLEQHDTETITMTASGCGVMILDYQHLLADDAEYAEKARRISEAYHDPIEIVAAAGDHAIAQLKNELKTKNSKPSVAFHPPCTLQHGHKITGQVEALLTALGYTLKPFVDSHLCCGSAGTYSITQKHLSRELLHNKISSIEAAETDMIITANIGCQTHLQSATAKPVRHWLELLA